MSSTFQLTPERLVEIKGLLADVAIFEASPFAGTGTIADRTLLARCSRALTDLLNDRDALVAANAAAAEELAEWNGHL